MIEMLPVNLDGKGNLYFQGNSWRRPRQAAGSAPEPFGACQDEARALLLPWNEEALWALTFCCRKMLQILK